LTDRQAGEKATKPDGDEIDLPGFHNYTYSLIFCELLPSLAISTHRRITRDALSLSLVFYRSIKFLSNIIRTNRRPFSAFC
jgi:hypothetical protein